MNADAYVLQIVKKKKKRCFTAAVLFLWSKNFKNFTADVKKKK